MEPPAGAEELWIDVDGVRVHAVEWNGVGERRVLLVHGLGGSTITWEPVAGELARRLPARITAVDLPGFGLTQPAAADGAGFRDHRRAVEGLLVQSGPATLFGNSMGGAVAVSVAARRPELVAALVLVDPALPSVGMQRSQWGAALRFAPMLVPALGARVLMARGRRLGATGLVDESLSWTMVDTSRLDPAVRDRLVELATERQRFPYGVWAYAESTRSLFWYLSQRMYADVARVTCPTLIVHGERDRLVPIASARALAARRRDITLEVFADCGHTPQLEMPQRFVDTVVSWLTTRWSPSTSSRETA